MIVSALLQIQPGPADERMYIKDAVDQQSYSQTDRSHYSGPSNHPTEAYNKGHFNLFLKNFRIQNTR